MCGIVGYNSRNSARMDRMLRSIHHRGPDDSGRYEGEKFSLGHVRLSILDLSSLGHQPMQYEHLVMVYRITSYNVCYTKLLRVFIVKFITPKIKRAGDKRERFQKDFFEIINSTLGNFKLIKLKSDQQEIMDRFSTASYGYAKSNIANETFGQFPRLFLEAIGFSIISFIVIYLVLKYQSDISGALALISMFVVGLFV